MGCVRGRGIQDASNPLKIQPAKGRIRIADEALTDKRLDEQPLKPIRLAPKGQSVPSLAFD